MLHSYIVTWLTWIDDLMCVHCIHIKLLLNYRQLPNESWIPPPPLTHIMLNPSSNARLKYAYIIYTSKEVQLIRVSYDEQLSEIYRIYIYIQYIDLF